MPARYTGKVHWFNSVKGYGFIGVDSDHENSWPVDYKDKDIFVHFTGIEGSGYKKLDQNMLVDFSLERGNSDKVQATHVKVLNESKTE